MSTAGRVDPSLPDPRLLDIDGRGSVAVWDLPATTSPALAHVPVLLLHGWNVDAPLNYRSALPFLRGDRRVVMFDQHGHGRGVRSTSTFDLPRCADDAVAVLDALEIDRAILVGYSLGGTVAQVIASEHRHRCAGVVLAATADSFANNRREAAQFSVLDQGARALRRLPERSREAAFRTISGIACRRYPPWVLETVLTADPVTLLEAGSSLGRFKATMWSSGIEAPCAVIVTSADTVVSPTHQHRLARLLDAIEVIEVPVDHDVPIRDDERYGDALARAVDVVASATIRSSVS